MHGHDHLKPDLSNFVGHMYSKKIHKKFKICMIYIDSYRNGLDVFLDGDGKNFGYYFVNATS